MYNCNNSNECPLQKKCLLDGIVYKAVVVTRNSEPKEHIGMTGNTFKKRYITTTNHSIMLHIQEQYGALKIRVELKGTAAGLHD